MSLKKYFLGLYQRKSKMSDNNKMLTRTQKRNKRRREQKRRQKQKQQQASNQVDYKALYERELMKNKHLEEKLELEKQIALLKKKVKDVKSVLKETIRDNIKAEKKERQYKAIIKKKINQLDKAKQYKKRVREIFREDEEKTYHVSFEYSYKILKGQGYAYNHTDDFTDDDVKAIVVQRDIVNLKGTDEEDVRNKAKTYFKTRAQDDPRAFDFVVRRLSNKVSLRDLKKDDIRDRPMRSAVLQSRYTTLGCEQNDVDLSLPTLGCVQRQINFYNEKAKRGKQKEINNRTFSDIIQLYRKKSDVDFTNREEVLEELEELEEELEILPEEEGITPNEINALCQYLNISHHCIDSSGKKLISHVPQKRVHGYGFCYMTNGEHMYPITDKIIRTKIAVAEGNVVEGILNEEMEKEITDITIMETLPEDLSQYTGDLFLTKTSSLNDVFEEQSLVRKQVYDQSRYKYSGCSMTMFQIRKDLTLWVNPNIEQIISICDKLDIPLTMKRLSLGSLANEIYALANEEKCVPKSTMNRLVLDKYLNVYSRGGIVECLVNSKEVKDMKLTSYDIKRCYTSALINLKLPVLDVWDGFRPYKGELHDDNDYAVITDNLFPMRGNGVYSGYELKEYEADGVPFNITGELWVKSFIPQDMVKNFVSKCEEIGSETKILPNALCGTMGKWRSHNTKVLQTDNLYEASHFYFNSRVDDKNKSCLFTGGEPFFQIQTEKSGFVARNGIPAWNRIVHYGWLSVWRMWKRMGGSFDTRIPTGLRDGQPIMNNVGGRLVRIATDCITVAGEIPESFQQYIGDSYGDYRIEEKEIKLRRSQIGVGWGDHGKMTYKRHLMDSGENVKRGGEWIKIDVEEERWEEKDWAENVAQKILETGSCFLKGRYAGVGKTYVATAFQNLLRKQNKESSKYAKRNIVSCSFTNSASYNLGGKTLHRLFGMKEQDSIDDASLGFYSKGDWIIVDEISMVPSAFYNLFEILKLRGVNFLIVGDFKQLPPVKDRKIDIENSYHFKRLCDFNMIDLQINKRSDMRMREVFDALWENEDKIVKELNIKRKDLRKISLSTTYISRLNETRKKVNGRLMRLACNDASEVYTSSFDIEKLNQEKRKKFQELMLVEGSPVVCVERLNGKAFNQQEGVLTGWDSNMVYLALENPETRMIEYDKCVAMSRKQFESHFTANYCMTCHRAQGKSLDGKVVIYDWDVVEELQDTFYKRWFYTAISRARSWDNLYLSE